MSLERHHPQRLSPYLITDRHKLPPGRDLLETIDEALRGGVRAVQLREKDLTPKEIYDLARKIRSLTKEYGALFFINDRLDIAMAVGADGVHLTTQSIPTEAVREVAGEKVIIGVSTHSIEELLTAKRQGADYVTFSPIFFTPSKAMYGPPKGITALEMACKLAGDLPVIALGGIKKDQVKQVMEAGAAGIAVVSFIISSKDPFKAAKELLSAWRA